MTPAARVRFYRNLIGADVFGFWYTHILIAFKLLLENVFLPPEISARALLRRYDVDVIMARGHIFGAKSGLCNTHGFRCELTR